MKKINYQVKCEVLHKISTQGVINVLFLGIGQALLMLNTGILTDI